MHMNKLSVSDTDSLSLTTTSDIDRELSFKLHVAQIPVNGLGRALAARVRALRYRYVRVRILATMS